MKTGGEKNRFKRQIRPFSIKKIECIYSSGVVQSLSYQGEPSPSGSLQEFTKSQFLYVNRDKNRNNSHQCPLENTLNDTRPPNNYLLSIMAVARPIRVLALVTLFLCTFLIYQTMSPISPLRGPGDDYKHKDRDPNLDRE